MYRLLSLKFSVQRAADVIFCEAPYAEFYMTGFILTIRTWCLLVVAVSENITLKLLIIFIVMSSFQLSIFVIAYVGTIK